MRVHLSDNSNKLYVHTGEGAIIFPKAYREKVEKLIAIVEKNAIKKHQEKLRDLLGVEYEQ